MSVSATTSKDASTKASVLFSNHLWARMLSYECQCHHEQGCFYEGISALLQLLLGKDAHTWVSVPSRAGMLLQRHQCSSATIVGQGCYNQWHQCSLPITLGQGCYNQWHQCSQPVNSGQGWSDQRHQCSLPVNFWARVIWPKTPVLHHNWSVNSTLM